MRLEADSGLPAGGSSAGLSAHSDVVFAATSGVWSVSFSDVRRR